MDLKLCTWAGVENYLESSQGVIMPIGSTEQHGPNGLIGTDAICAEAIALAVGERAQAMVVPTISVGMAQHHMAFAGSMTLRPSTLIAVIRDMVVSLQAHGFRVFYFVNGHGGNISTVNAAFAEIYSEASLRGERNAAGPRCVLRNWWLAPKVSELRKKLYGDADGAHATPSEIAVTQHLHPGAVREHRFDSPAPGWGDFSDAQDYRRRYPDGRIGSDPALANADDGKRLFDLAVEELAEDYQKFLKG